MIPEYTFITDKKLWVKLIQLDVYFVISLK